MSCPRASARRCRRLESRAAGGEFGKEGGRGKKKDKTLSYDVTKGLERGNSQAYLARRLATAAPEILTEWENGTIPSMRQAAIAAGIIKVPSKLAKYETWEDMKKSSACGELFPSQAVFGQAKSEKGVGITLIHDFLGKQWSRYLIANTLSVIKQEEDAERKKAEAWAKTSCGA